MGPVWRCVNGTTGDRAVRENDVREVRWCLVVGGLFGSMLVGKCDVRESWCGGKGGRGCLSRNNVKRNMKLVSWVIAY